MLHGATVKAAIWCLTIIGLTPALVLALAALVFESLHRSKDLAPTEEGSSSQVVFQHHFWVQIGPIRVENWHPRAWAAILIAAGAILIVIALFFLLHVSLEIENLK